jgi:L-2-hydroxyglutarate oxidase LhgO
VATEEAEVARIEAIFEQGVANEVEGLDHLTGAQAQGRWSPA